jgi:hypothetical protein
MELEEYEPSESWKSGKGGTKADREHGFDFLGIADDWEEPNYLA